MCCRYWSIDHIALHKLSCLMHRSGRYNKVVITKASFGYCIYATKELLNTDTTEYRLGETL